MQRVYTAQNPIEAHLKRSFLEAEGIRTVIQNEHLFGVRGDLPMIPDTLPEVWVVDDRDYDDAVALLAEPPAATPTDDASALDARRAHGDRFERGEVDGAERPQVGTPAAFTVIKLLVSVFIGVVGGWYLHSLKVEADSRMDANGDGKVDSYWSFGTGSTYHLDLNFDGTMDSVTKFDWRDIATTAEVDTDFDGSPNCTITYVDNVPVREVIYKDSPARPVSISTMRHGIRAEATFDTDNDGTLDRKYTYDPYGRVTSEEPLRPR